MSKSLDIEEARKLLLNSAHDADGFFCPVCLNVVLGGPGLEAFSHALYGFQISCPCGVTSNIRRSVGGTRWYKKPIPASIQKKMDKEEQS